MPKRKSTSGIRKNCTAISYNCGAICLSLAKTCRIGSAGIGKDRIAKLKALASSLEGGGKDDRRGLGKPSAETLRQMALNTENQRTSKAQQLKEQRRGQQEISGNEGLDPGGSDSTGVTGGRPIVRVTTARADITPTPDTSIVPERLRQSLSPDQLNGAAAAIASMDRTGGFLLADGTGVGKTRQMLAVAQNYADQGKKVIIITKAEVIKPDWKKGKLSGSFANDGEAMGIGVRLTKSDDLKPGEVAISTYDNLSKIKGAIDKNTVVIYDEAHSMKNSDSQRTKHGMDMSRNADKVLFATATPADKPTHIDYLARAGVFNGRSKKEIYEWMGMREREINVPGGRTVRKWEIDPRVGAQEVYHRMAGLFDEMTEKGRMIKREISMDGVKFDFQNIILPKEAYDMLDSIERQYAGGTGLEAAQMLMHQRRQLEPYKIPAAVDSAKKARANGQQAVIFVSRVSESGVDDDQGEKIASSAGTAGSLKKALLDAGFDESDITELHGGAKNKADKAMNDFQSGKAKVIIATVESGGTGINLDDTVGDSPRKLIMMTPPFSAVENVQAIGRVWRLKTQSYPEVEYLFTDTAVDGWNRQIIGNKVKALGAAVQGETGQLDIPIDISEEGIASFMSGKKSSGVVLSGKSPRPPEPKIGAPPGYYPNKYGGYYQGKWIEPGDGYIKKVGGRWELYPKNVVLGKKDADDIIRFDAAYWVSYWAAWETLED